jgi:hypothetical protein
MIFQIVLLPITQLVLLAIKFTHDRVSRVQEERLDHQDSLARRESWEYRDLPDILDLRERKEIKARKARMVTQEKREIG